MCENLLWRRKSGLNFIAVSGMIKIGSSCEKYRHREGGDSMSMDAIKQVTDSEAQARECKAQAQAQAQSILAEARKGAQAAQAEARKGAQARAQELLERTEAQAKQDGQETLAGFDAKCEALKAGAAKKLDEAAALIVGRVVKS